MAGLLLLAAGCGAGSPAPAPTSESALPPPIATPSPAATPIATAPSSTPVAFRSAAAAVGPVVWATVIDDETRAPRDQATWIAANTPTIYATVAVERIAAGTTVAAQWSYNRTRLETLDQVIVAERPESGVWLEFHLTRNQGETWPTGTYELSVAVNGEPAVAGSIEVGNTPP